MKVKEHVSSMGREKAERGSERIKEEKRQGEESIFIPIPINKYLSLQFLKNMKNPQLTA